MKQIPLVGLRLITHATFALSRGQELLSLSILLRQGCSTISANLSFFSDIKHTVRLKVQQWTYLL